VQQTISFSERIVSTCLDYAELGNSGIQCKSPGLLNSQDAYDHFTIKKVAPQKYKKLRETGNKMVVA